MTELLNGIPRVDPTSRPTLMRLSRGHFHFAKGTVPLVLLRTTGAKSGVQRDVPLGYFTDGDDVILIASNYGQAKHPSWYYNLLKHPKCQLFADGREDRGGSFIARPTQSEDHDRLFGLAEAYISNFKTYAENTNGIRSIPVLRLTPQAR